MQLWQLLTVKQLGSRRLVHYSNVMGKQEKLHIWNLDSRQQVLAGRCVAVGLVLMAQALPGSLSQQPLLAGPVMLFEDFSPGFGCHLPAPGSCQPWNKQWCGYSPSITNKGKVVLSSLSVKPGRLQLEICTCSCCSSHCTVIEGLGKRLSPPFAKRFERACNWMQALDQSCLSTGLASPTEPSYKCGIWELSMTCNRREMVKYPWKAAE